MYSGLSCKKSIANMNINIGPITQLRNNDIPKTFVFLKTSFNFSYLTLANGGYIINIKPTAKGMFVVPVENELINVDEDGKKYPMATPKPIAKKIHKVKYLSKKPNFFLSKAGAQIFADILVF